MYRPDNTSGQLYTAPIALRPGSHTISAVTVAPRLDRPSRSLDTLVYLVIGNALPPPVFAPHPWSVVQQGATVALASAAAGTLFQYAVVGAGEAVANASWNDYTGPIALDRNCRVLVLQVCIPLSLYADTDTWTAIILPFTCS